MSSENFEGELSTISSLLVDIDSTSATNIATVLETLRKLESFPSSQAQAWKVLANKSRDERWRDPFGQNGLVTYSASILCDTRKSGEERLHILRFIGNCCADHDGNRQIVIDQGALEEIGRSITYPDLESVASTVLFNVFNDYEPARKASTLALFNNCLTPLTTGMIDSGNSAFNCTCQNLQTILSALDIDELETTSQSFLLDAVSLIKYVADIEGQIEDLDDYFPLLNSCIILLRHDRTKEVLSTHLGLILQIFRKVSERLQILPADLSDAEHKSILEAADSELLDLLCDMASNANISISNEDGSRPWKILRDWLSTTDQQLPHVCFVCAALVVGNLAREDDVCESLVLDQGIHLPLIESIQNDKDRRVLHAAGGCLRNLSVPTKNKEVIAEAGALEAIMGMLQISVVRELPYLGACITRQLVNGSFGNVQRLLLKAHPQAQTDADPTSYLDTLLQASSQSDDLAIKAEVARTVTAIFRVLSTAKESQDQIDRTREQVLSHAALLAPVEAVIRQQQSKPLRSEGWFALALIAQTEDGARTVTQNIANDEILTLLQEQINGAGERGEPDLHSGGKERENTLVLVTSLLQKARGDMSETQRHKLKVLLKGQNIELGPAFEQD